MKHLATPIEFSFASESFNLEVQQTTNGERLALELREAEADRHATEVLQEVLGKGWKVESLRKARL